MDSNYAQEDKAMTTVKEALERISGVDPSKIAGLNAVICFEMTGEGGGKWTLTLEDGKAKLDEGEAAPPDMTLSMDAQDFLAMTRGELNAMAAFMQGKIKITGDMSLAMRLQSILA
jgi:putative sterol carrier protein